MFLNPIYTNSRRYPVHPKAYRAEVPDEDDDEDYDQVLEYWCLG